jgi:hypothetical protein
VWLRCSKHEVKCPEAVRLKADLPSHSVLPSIPQPAPRFSAFAVTWIRPRVVGRYMKPVSASQTFFIGVDGEANQKACLSIVFMYLFHSTLPCLLRPPANPHTSPSGPARGRNFGLLKTGETGERASGCIVDRFSRARWVKLLVKEVEDQ